MSKKKTEDLIVAILRERQPRHSGKSQNLDNQECTKVKQHLEKQLESMPGISRVCIKDALTSTKKKKRKKHGSKSMKTTQTDSWCFVIPQIVQNVKLTYKRRCDFGNNSIA